MPDGRLVEDQQSRPAREREQERRLGPLAVRQALTGCSGWR